MISGQECYVFPAERIVAVERAHKSSFGQPRESIAVYRGTTIQKVGAIVPFFHSHAEVIEHFQ